VSVAAQLVNAVKVYGSGATAVRALNGVSAAFARGELTVIMGPSGSGKSTLLHCLAGLDRLTEGSAEIDGVTLAGLNDTALTVLRRERVGFVFQSFNLVPMLTADENILLPLSLGGRKPDPDWFADLVQSLNLQGRLKHRPSELSGGEQQRVAVARALVTHPALLFADEPTGNLDSTSAMELLELIRGAVRRLNQSVVMVTHDPRAAGFADRVLFLVDGRIVRELSRPSTDDILDAFKSFGE
jgi:putative ABC transport system ATP-binding protein